MGALGHQVGLELDPFGTDGYKRLLADLVTCPTLGATSEQPQTNPLLDNYEGLAVTGEVRRRGQRLVGLSLISDDNFGAGQTTRVLNLAVALRRS